MFSVASLLPPWHTQASRTLVTPTRPTVPAPPLPPPVEITAHPLSTTSKAATRAYLPAPAPQAAWHPPTTPDVPPPPPIPHHHTSPPRLQSVPTCQLQLFGRQGILPVQDVVPQPPPAPFRRAAPLGVLEPHLQAAAAGCHYYAPDCGRALAFKEPCCRAWHTAPPAQQAAAAAASGRLTSSAPPGPLPHLPFHPFPLPHTLSLFRVLRASPATCNTIRAVHQPQAQRPNPMPTASLQAK